MKSLWIDRDKLLALVGELTAGHVSYGLGSKASLTTEPKDVKKIDCSGFVRYLLYKATDGQVKMPDGSWHQNKWCDDNGFAKVDYAAEAGLNDSWLRLGYFPKKKGMAAGHIWFVLNGQTIESHGGKGPNRREWDTKVLKNNVTRCYKIGLTHTYLCLPIPIVNQVCLPWPF